MGSPTAIYGQQQRGQSSCLGHCCSQLLDAPWCRFAVLMGSCLMYMIAQLCACACTRTVSTIHTVTYTYTCTCQPLLPSQPLHILAPSPPSLLPAPPPDQTGSDLWDTVRRFTENEGGMCSAHAHNAMYKACERSRDRSENLYQTV